MLNVMRAASETRARLALFWPCDLRNYPDGDLLCGKFQELFIAALLVDGLGKDSVGSIGKISQGVQFRKADGIGRLAPNPQPWHARHSGKLFTQ